MCYSWRIPHKSTKKKRELLFLLGKQNTAFGCFFLKLSYFGIWWENQHFRRGRATRVRAMPLRFVPGPSCIYISPCRFPAAAAPCTPSVMTPITITVRGWNSKHFVKANGFQMWTLCEPVSEHRAGLRTLEQVATPILERAGRIRQLDLWLLTYKPICKLPSFSVQRCLYLADWFNMQEWSYRSGVHSLCLADQVQLFQSTTWPGSRWGVDEGKGLIRSPGLWVSCLKKNPFHSAKECSTFSEWTLGLWELPLWLTRSGAV